MDLSRLRKGEKIAGAAGLALFIFMFFDWYGGQVSVSGFGAAAGGGVNAWQAFDIIDIILLITAVVAVGLTVLTATQRAVNLPVAASAITAALGIIATLLVLYRVIDPPGPAIEGFGGVEVDVTRKIGVWLGLIASAGVAIGGWLSMQEEGTTFGEAKDQLSNAVSGSEGAEERPTTPTTPATPPTEPTPPPAPGPQTPPPVESPPEQPPPPGEGGGDRPA